MNNFWQNLKKPFSVLAPMEEVTDTVFRQIILECGRPDVFFTEFTSTDGLMSKGRDKVIRRFKYDPIEKPLVAQIWGNKPENYYNSAKLINELGFDGVDINMGCPVRKVIKRGECSGLIINKPLAKEIVLATIEGAGDIPVSVKTRMGFREIETEVWTEYLLKLGIKALTVHGRLAKDMSKYPADWEEIGKAVKVRDSLFEGSLEKPVIIGNGDVQDIQDIQTKAEKYGIDGGMIGRGIFQDPFAFNPSKSLIDLNLKERLELLLRHSRKFVDVWGEKRNFSVLKRYFKIYVSGIEDGNVLRNALMHCDNLPAVEKLVASQELI